MNEQTTATPLLNLTEENFNEQARLYYKVHLESFQ